MMSKGRVFGLESMLQSRWMPRFTALAIETYVEVYAIKAETILHLAVDYPELRYEMRRWVAHRALRNFLISMLYEHRVEMEEREAELTQAAMQPSGGEASPRARPTVQRAKTWAHDMGGISSVGEALGTSRSSLLEDRLIQAAVQKSTKEQTLSDTPVERGRLQSRRSSKPDARPGRPGRRDKGVPPSPTEIRDAAKSVRIPSNPSSPPAVASSAMASATAVASASGNAPVHGSGASVVPATAAGAALGSLETKVAHMEAGLKAELRELRQMMKSIVEAVRPAPVVDHANAKERGARRRSNSNEIAGAGVSVDEVAVSVSQTREALDERLSVAGPHPPALAEGGRPTGSSPRSQGAPAATEQSMTSPPPEPSAHEGLRNQFSCIDGSSSSDEEDVARVASRGGLAA